MPVTTFLFLLATQLPGATYSALLDSQPYPVGEVNEVPTKYEAREKGYWQTRNAWALKLYSVDPNNERVARVLSMTWANLGRSFAEPQIDSLLAKSPTPAVEALARYTRAKYQLASLPANHTDADVMAIWEEMSSHCLYASQAPEVLFACTQKLSSKVNRTREYRILAQLYPGFERLPEVSADLKDWTGRPNFELDFREVCTQKPDSICQKRGHVILVYFSPDGNPPQAIQDLYVRYHNAGLEAIGIAATNNPSPKPWPLVADANQGVKKSWGVDQSPTVFLVDKEGCLAYANPSDIEGHVKELMAQR